MPGTDLGRPDSNDAAHGVLRLEHRFDAPPEAVFDAWLDPRVLREWWGVGDDWRAGVVDIDPRPGGRYRLSMVDHSEDGGGNEHTVGGRYLEVERPRRLVFTWAWEADGPDGAGHEETLVRVEFEPSEAGTRLTLTHERLPNAVSREMHVVGWQASLARLANAVRPPGPRNGAS